MSEETEKSTDPAETIYSGIRHTVAMAITHEEGETPETWNDLDFRSPHQDVELALQEYLQGIFGEEIEIHHEDDILYVDEPGQPAGSLRRHYRPNA